MQMDSDNKQRFLDLMKRKMPLGRIARELGIDMLTAFEWSQELAETIASQSSETTEEYDPDSKRLVVCDACGERNFPGEARCVKCNAGLRPTLLGVMTIIGPIALILRIIMLVSSGSASGVPFACVESLGNVVAIGVLVCLRHGSHGAWVVAQVMQAIGLVSICAFTFMAMRLPMRDDTLITTSVVSAAVGTAIIIAWWCYLRSDRVKAFCSK